MEQHAVNIKGANVNNLKNVDVSIPLRKITCIYGPSGSGKSSLAFHCLYQESKRRFLNSFPNYLKFFGDRPQKVDVESINPVLPVFAMPQINPVIGSRSLALDVSGVVEKLQLFFGSHASLVCPDHRVPLAKKDLAKLLVSKAPEGSRSVNILLEKDLYKDVFSSFYPMRSYCKDGGLREFNGNDELWEVTRVKLDKLDQSSALKELEEKLQQVSAKLFFLYDGKLLVTSRASYGLSCPVCEFTSDLKRNSKYFSPYNSLGACELCNGFGSTLEYDDDKLININKSVDDGGVQILEFKPFRHMKKHLLNEMKSLGLSATKPIKELGDAFISICYQGHGKYPGFEKCFSYLNRKKYKRSIRVFIRKIQKEEPCYSCKTSRISKKYQAFAIKTKDGYLCYHDLALFSFKELYHLFSSGVDCEEMPHYPKKLRDELCEVLAKVVDLGLQHLGLFRKSKTLSAGEYQRLLIVKYFAFKGTGALFVFDEPSLGLSIKEQKKVLNFMNDLCQQGNTVLLVEHSHFFIENADRVIEMGPEAGDDGGEVLYQGAPRESFVPKIKDRSPLKKKKDYLSLRGLKVRGVAFSDLTISLGELNWLTGPSGSGKTSAILHGLLNIFTLKLSNVPLTSVPFNYSQMTGEGDRFIENVVHVSSTYSRSSGRSSFGSMSGLSVMVRKYLASLPVSKSMDLRDGHFSVNSKLGVCPYCEGRGEKVIEMQFLEDVKLECEYCKGKKLRPEIAMISDGDYYAYQYLEKPVRDIISNIPLTPKYKKIYKYIEMLNLDYLSLNRSQDTLSGGEIQRLGLLNAILGLRKKTLFYIENVSFGLSYTDLIKVLALLNQLTQDGHTVVLADSEVLCSKFADYRIHIDANHRVRTFKKAM